MALPSTSQSWKGSPDVGPMADQSAWMLIATCGPLQAPSLILACQHASLARSDVLQLLVGLRPHLEAKTESSILKQAGLRRERP